MPPGGYPTVMRRREILLTGLAVLAAVALLGPRARMGDTTPGPWGAEASLPPLPALEAHLRSREAAVPRLRAGDGKEIVWADPAAPARTPLAVVYLHGFSADPHEMDPVPRQVAAALDANLFLTRLTGHGQDGAALGEATAADWLRDTEEALQVGRRLGERVVVMGASTGATLALAAAAADDGSGTLAALVLVSPNLGPRDQRARVLLWPWGGLLARVLVGRERCFQPLNEAQARHWTTCYPTRALLPMMALVEHVRTSDPARVRAPLLVLYSPGDLVVDARETERIFPRFGSTVKRLEIVDRTEDPARHVLAGDILSPSANDAMTERIVDFVRGAVGAPP